MAITPETLSIQDDCSSSDDGQSYRLVSSDDRSQQFAGTGRTETALTSVVLRYKLDRAILAEAWEAVRAIRERIDEVERASASDSIAVDVDVDLK